MKRVELILLVCLFIFSNCSGFLKDPLEDTTKIPSAAIYSLETEEDLDILLSEIGDARLVLLGEATHGTSEFYIWRARISKRLIQEKNFRIIAVEGDWTDAYSLNNYIRGHSNYSTAKEALKEFDRWPQWMWANEEISEFAEWLKIYNSGKTVNQQIGFYGLDLYGMWESIDSVHAFLEQTDPAAALISGRVKDCFSSYSRDEQAYMQSVVISGESCAGELKALLGVVREKFSKASPADRAIFNALQNTLVAVNAEHYYRIAATGNPLSWNIRDEHMTGTVVRLLDRAGPNEKIIIWEHNTHVGDARATDMVNSGLVNVGQLVREEYGIDEVYIVGFGTYRGKVLAAPAWGTPVKVMNVPGAKRHSWEWVLHNMEPRDKIVIMDYLKKGQHFQKPVGHRAIGVVYNPAAETGNYVPSVMPARYDAFIFIDKTTALKPLK